MDDQSKTAGIEHMVWDLPDTDDPNGVKAWFWTGIPFKPLPPVLRKKFIENHHTQKDSLASIIKNVAATMQPGEDRALGPFEGEEAAKKALGRIRNILTRYKPWLEGYTAGTVVDDEGGWYASFMRGWEIKEVKE